MLLVHLVGVPNATNRLSILQVLLSKIPNKLTVKELENVSLVTHGYVGADLAAIIRDAGTLAIRRQLSDGTSDSPLLRAEDLATSIKAVRPSALREHFVETPKVHWSDVGGQGYVKEKLKECVEWPLLYPASFLRLGVTPTQGCTAVWPSWVQQDPHCSSSCY